MTKVKSKTLSLAMPQPASPISSTVTSPSETDSRTASPSRMREAEMYQYRAGNGEFGTRGASPSLEEAKTRKGSAFTSLPSVPHSPQNVPRHGQSRSLFGNLKAAKSSNKVDKLETTIRQVSEDQPRDNVSSGVAGIYSLGKGPGSTPDLSLSTLNTSNMDIPGGQDEPDSARRPLGSSILSDTALLTTSTASSTSRKTKPRFAQLLTRTRSIRTDEGGGRRSKPPTPIQTPVQEDRASIDEGDDHRGLKTAPLDMESNRSFRDLMGSAIRNKSADRQQTNKASTASNLLGRAGGEHRGLSSSSSAVFRDGTGSKLFANIKGTSSKAADGLGKAGKGLFNKMGRSGSSNNRDEAGDAHYTLKVINLPLVEQTRHTRIARRLEDSRDKTEFWMPALPWRCIDYLNFRGCEEEGLYRVPGSGTKIKQYQERFDRELDINLFDEADLFDINIIGSLFKAWLRDLPSEILPKTVQARVAAAHPNVNHVPQMLKDELSSLPPWNYYLLFAITCHLSLLHDHHDKNKMSYSNLCICFQPCIGIDAYCFQFLVCDWRSCWQGCWTEKEYLEQEYRVIDCLDSPVYGEEKHYEDSDSGTIVVDQPTPQSAASSNSRPSLFGRSRERNQQPPPLSAAQTNTKHATQSNTRIGHNRSDSQLPELQPMVPLSPMGWENSSNRASLHAPPTGR
ncbi:MAG: hypothetical protein LQ345_003573 [Seirophora villosa]|nr:MAG: hypothetical protein LQ345_003573 [Seirophora villosa]